MRSILSARYRAVLETFAASSVLVAFDFDGTLAPIVDTPGRASMRPSTRRVLAAVAARYPVAVISGRSRRDVTRRLGAIPVRHITGNHGLEPWGEAPAFAALVNGWLAHLTAAIGGQPGIRIENKTYSLTVHYRGARSKAELVRTLHRVAGSLPEARVVKGIESIALVPRHAPDKGAALGHLRRLFACDTAIFVGDDETDEDAFGSAGPETVLAIRVGARRRSKAPYYVPSQQDVDALLAILADCRAPENVVQSSFRRARTR